MHTLYCDIKNFSQHGPTKAIITLLTDWITQHPSNVLCTLSLSGPSFHPHAFNKCLLNTFNTDNNSSSSYLLMPDTVLTLYILTHLILITPYAVGLLMSYPFYR